jgi:G3E family GTPase
VDKYVGTTVIRQLQGADLIPLNQVDLVDANALQAVRSLLQGLVPDAWIAKMAHGLVPLPVLIRVSETSEKGRNACAPHQPEYEDKIWSLTGDQPLDGNAFRSVVEDLPAGVIHVKKKLFPQENTNRRYIFQLVGDHLSIKTWKMNNLHQIWI